MNVELIDPNEALRESYLGHLREFTERKEHLIPFCLGFPNGDFPAFVAKLRDCAEGIGIPAEFAAHSTFWLVRDGRDVVGVSSLRHYLTPALWLDGCHIGYGIRPSERRKGYATLILRETLRKAKAREISRVFITCYKGNIGSARTIQKNGGVLDSEYQIPGHPDLMQRYSIDQ